MRSCPLLYGALASVAASPLQERQADSNIDASVFLRRSYHSSAVLGSWLYVDGGEFSFLTSQIQHQYSSTLLAIDLSKDFTVSSVTMTSGTKPRLAPNLRAGGMWADDQNQVLYTGFAGVPSAFGDHPSATSGLWSFTPDGAGDGTWTNLNSTADSSFVRNIRPFGGLAASGNGKGYYLGGFQGNNTVPGNDVPLNHISGLLTYDFQTKKVANTSVVGISTGGVAQIGRMMYVPHFGTSGILVSVGGTQVGKLSSGVDALLPMSTVQVFDTASGRWYEQTTSGIVPESRKEFCMAGAVSDNRTFDILVYAGWGGNLGSVAVNFDEAFILSLPAFRWFKADFTPLHPRHGLSCEHLGGGQILTIGGLDTTQVNETNLYEGPFNTQDPFRQGLNVFDLSAMAFRTNYSASQKTYTMNPDIQSYYNNHDRTPSFDSSGLSLVFQTQNFPASASNGATSVGTAAGPPTGAIAGAVIGIIVAALIGGLTWYFLRRRRRQKQQRQAGISSPPQPPPKVGGSVSYAHEKPGGGGWYGPFEAPGEQMNPHELEPSPASGPGTWHAGAHELVSPASGVPVQAAPVELPADMHPRGLAREESPSNSSVRDERQPRQYNMI